MSRSFATSPVARDFTGFSSRGNHRVEKSNARGRGLSDFRLETFFPRYSYFIVNEVDLDGNIVRLTSLDAPPEIAEGKKEKMCDLLAKDYSPEIEIFRVLAGGIDPEKLKAFIGQVSSSVGGSNESVVLSPSSDKSHLTMDQIPHRSASDCGWIWVKRMKREGTRGKEKIEVTDLMIVEVQIVGQNTLTSF
ncbi:uncharacterized protein [Primulina eburnea]|uniref:uncharacterized protein isoform X1 n=1 Tax=Primulina eburnea TaxID=1245227 RepID=UPI003C6C5A30